MQMIERVARALWDAQYPSGSSWDDWADHVSRNPDSFDGRDTCRKLARAAIEAMRDPVIGQVSAAARKAEAVGAGDFVAIWNAMIDAALADGGG